MNILLLMADEFRHDAAGYAGNAFARTPTLDRLAHGARNFTNALTPSPVCVPARQCLATGRYPLHIGCESFVDDLAPGADTFARRLAGAGYYTVACGKLHHRGPDQMQGWLHRIGAETAVRWPERFSDRPQIGRRKWRGMEDILTAGPGESALGIQDDLAVRGAEDFIRMHFGGMTAADPAWPLCLMVSLQQPHFPLATEPGLFDHYCDTVDVPPDLPPLGHDVMDANRIDAPREAVRRARAAYFGMVEQTDRRFGRVVAALEKAGQDLSRWAVVFLSDHGDMLGEHGRWEKRCFYEGSVRVPLFLRAPGVSPGADPAAASLVDVFPTLCGLAGVAVPEGLDGSDLLACGRRDEAFSQYGRDNFLLRTGQWKYLRFAGAPEVVFDLVNDPAETRNLIASADHAGVVRSLRTRMDAFLAPTCESGQKPA